MIEKHPHQVVVFDRSRRVSAVLYARNELGVDGKLYTVKRADEDGCCGASFTRCGDNGCERSGKSEKTDGERADV